MTSFPNIRRLAEAYYIAKTSVLDAGFAPEIDWQYEVSLETLTEEAFLRETAWVILSSGMSELVVKRKFPELSRIFRSWESAKLIVEYADECYTDAMSVFGNIGKLNAILYAAEHVDRRGFCNVRQQIQEEGMTYLQTFPFLGPTTSYHLAKNIGFHYAKPDRHLSRIAEGLGYHCVQNLCADISNLTAEPVSVIDLVLWRYATLNSDYLAFFSEASNS